MKTKTILNVVAFVIHMTLMPLYSGLVFSKLWGWFIASKFPGAPQLSYLDSVGVTLMIGFFTLGLVLLLNRIEQRLKEVYSTKEDSSWGINGLVVGLVMYSVMLLVGFIWHQVIG